MLRVHNHFVLLQAKLAESNKTKILPSIPDPVIISSINETEHLEKKRRQYQRYLVKLMAGDYHNFDELKIFLTNTSVKLFFLFL